MGKAKKKRNKKYSGIDAKTPSATTVHRVTAVARTPRGEWFHDHKKTIKRVTIGGIIAIVIILLIVQGFTAL